MASNNTQIAAGSGLKAELEQMIREGLDEIGKGYNSVEERVYKIEEKRIGRSKHTQTIVQRLAALEARDHPVDHQAREAFTQVENTATQLTTIKDRIKTLQTDNSDHTSSIVSLSKSFHDANARNKNSQAETNATLERLVNRVNELESRAKDARNDVVAPTFTSAQEIADALLARLNRGDRLEADTIAQLKRAIGSSRSVAAQPARLPDTPSTDQEPPMPPQKPASKRKRVAEQEAQAKPAKRAKTTVEKPAAAPPKGAPAKRSKTAPVPHQRASPRGNKTASASTPASAFTSFASDGQPDGSQPRRTSRAAKPTKRANYMTWLEVKAARSSQNK